MRVPVTRALILIAVAVLLPQAAVKASAREHSPDQETVLPWHTTLDAALAQAKETGRPVFFNCFVDWSGACVLMDSVVLRDAELSAWIQDNFVPLRIDMRSDEGRALARRYGVSTYAQYLVLDAEGDIVHRICGGAKAEPFRARLSDALSDATSLRGTRLRVESGQASAADTVAYLRALRTASEGDLFTRVGKDFAVRQEPEKYLRPDYWTFAVLAMRGSERHLNYLVEHRAAFVAAHGEREYENMVESVLAGRILPWAQGSQSPSAPAAELEHLLQMIRSAELPPYLPTAFLGEMAELRQEHRWLDIQLLWDERGACLKKYPTVYKTLLAKINASGKNK